MTGQDQRRAFVKPVVGSILDGLADPQAALGGGSASAVAAEMAAALVAKAARRSVDTWPDARGASAQAGSLAARCSELADSDARAFERALKALEARAGIEERLGESVAVLLALAETATDIAELAAWTAEHCDGMFRGDAICAALLAEAAACGAAVLVAGNLAVTERDERLLRVKRFADVATGALRRALEAGP